MIPSTLLVVKSTWWLQMAWHHFVPSHQQPLNFSIMSLYHYTWHQSICSQQSHCEAPGHRSHFIDLLEISIISHHRFAARQSPRSQSSTHQSLVCTVPHGTMLPWPGIYLTKNSWPHNPNLIKNIGCCHVKNNHANMSQFCTCHDSMAVVACAKSCPVWIIRIRMIIKRIF